jgi:hypothetical protein
MASVAVRTPGAARPGALLLPWLLWLAATILVRGQHLRYDGLLPEFMLIDLDGNGIHFTSADDGVRFTFAEGRSPEQTAWTLRGAGDAFVAIDRDRNGRITSADELLGGKVGPPNGFEYLSRVMAGPGRGSPPRLDRSDPVFRQLVLWTDIDHDGQSAEGELQSLEYAGFVAIDLAGVAVVNDPPDAAGNVVTRRGRAMRGPNGLNPAELITVRLSGKTDVR